MRFWYAIILVLALVLDIFTSQLGFLNFMYLSLVWLIAWPSILELNGFKAIGVTVFSICFGLVTIQNIGLVAVAFAIALLISSFEMSFKLLAFSREVIFTVSFFLSMLIGTLIVGERPTFIWAVLFLVVNSLLTLLLQTVRERSKQHTHV